MAQPYHLFVDTNILLDFYRVRNESGLKLLSSLESVSDRVITTYQVEMEFKKNRHRALLETFKSLKDPVRVPHAAFLAETTAATKLDQVVKNAGDRVKKMKDRLHRVLENPTSHDPVYQSVQRMFVSSSNLNLKRSNAQRRQVKRLALRRFLLGYPPRKSNDTSMGDAFNWEWIIRVASERGCHVRIVSRDADYGIEMDGKPHVNDWLLQEFRDRVAKTRKLVLHTRLSAALKAMRVSVDEETERAENVVADEQAASRKSLELWPEIGTKGWISRYEKFMQDLDSVGDGT